MNLHVGIPHKDSYLRDDFQLLYVTGGIAAQFYSSANDMGYTPAVGAPRPASAIRCHISTRSTTAVR